MAWARTTAGWCFPKRADLPKPRRADCREGDLIQAVDGRKTPNLRQFQRVIRGARGTVTLKVVRNQQEMQVKVTL